jgi:hypothetical protein
VKVSATLTPPARRVVRLRDMKPGEMGFFVGSPDSRFMCLNDGTVVRLSGPSYYTESGTIRLSPRDDSEVLLLEPGESFTLTAE